MILTIETVINQMDILTRITPYYRQEEWHEQCECYRYGISSGKKLKFRDQSLFIARMVGGGGGSPRIFGGVTWLLGEQNGGSFLHENPRGDHWKEFRKKSIKGTTQMAV